MTDPIRLCHMNDLEDGNARGFDPFQQGRDSIFVVRRGSEVFGYRNACPHRGYEGTSMAWRKDRFLNKTGTRIVCGAHGAQFDIHSGECLAGPCPGQSLEAISLTLTSQGELYLNIDLNRQQ